jgi:ribosomal protein S12 methylthiotransferase accessory factor
VRAAFSSFDGDPATLDPERLPHRATNTCVRDLELAWIPGFDMGAGRELWVPLDAVHLDSTGATGDAGAVIDLNSNGLGSGNTMSEAVLHGLCEVVESDSWALEWRRRTRGRSSPWIDPWGASPLVDDLLTRCVSAGFLVQIRDLTSDIGVPVVEAVIAEHRGDHGLPPMQPAHGLGCHPEATVAVCRAITEAAQVRLGLIAGSRDDLRTLDYAADWSPPPEATDEEASLAFASQSSRPQTNIEQDIATVLSRLGEHDIREVIGVDLSPPEGSPAVVRIIVPDLEAYPGLWGYAPGPRALSIDTERS